MFYYERRQSGIREALPPVTLPPTRQNADRHLWCSSTGCAPSHPSKHWSTPVMLFHLSRSLPPVKTPIDTRDALPPVALPPTRQNDDRHPWCSSTCRAPSHPSKRWSTPVMLFHRSRSLPPVKTTIDTRDALPPVALPPTRQNDDRRPWCSSTCRAPSHPSKRWSTPVMLFHRSRSLPPVKTTIDARDALPPVALPPTRQNADRHPWCSSAGRAPSHPSKRRSTPVMLFHRSCSLPPVKMPIDTCDALPPVALPPTLQNADRHPWCSSTGRAPSHPSKRRSMPVMLFHRSRSLPPVKTTIDARDALPPVALPPTRQNDDRHPWCSSTGRAPSHPSKRRSTPVMLFHRSRSLPPVRTTLIAVRLIVWSPTPMSSAVVAATLSSRILIKLIKSVGFRPQRAVDNTRLSAARRHFTAARSVNRMSSYSVISEITSSN